MPDSHRQRLSTLDNEVRGAFSTLGTLSWSSALLSLIFSFASRLFSPAAPMTTPPISGMPASARVPQTSSTPFPELDSSGVPQAELLALQAFVVESAQTNAQQLHKLSHELQLTALQLSDHFAAMPARRAAESHLTRRAADLTDMPSPPDAQEYVKLLAPYAAAPQATGLGALLEMLGEREKDLDFNTKTNRIQGLQKGMHQMFMQMTNAVETFSNTYAEFSGSVSPTTNNGNVNADFSLAVKAANQVWDSLRKTVITVSDPKHLTPVLEGLRAASGLKQFFSADTTGGGKNLELLTEAQAGQLLNPVYKALGGTTNKAHTSLNNKRDISSMKLQEVKSTMDGVAEQLRTRLNQMMDGFSRINEVYDNLLKILTSTYQADADSRKSFLQ